MEREIEILQGCIGLLRKTLDKEITGKLADETVSSVIRILEGLANVLKTDQEIYELQNNKRS